MNPYMVFLRVRHLKVGAVIACGERTAYYLNHATDDPRKVECTRCRRTGIFRNAEDLLIARAEIKRLLRLIATVLPTTGRDWTPDHPELEAIQRARTELMNAVQRQFPRLAKHKPEPSKIEPPTQL